MLSLLKKKTEATSTSLIPAWHPNFRNYALLPDIKPVRTAFFVNGITALVALGILSFMARREYELHSVNAQIVAWQQQIDKDKPGNDQAIVLFKKFQDEQKRLLEVDAFIKSKPIVSELLQRFADTRPKNIALDNLEIRAPEGSGAPSIALRGVVRGSPDLATGEAASYLDLLKNDPVFGPKFDDVAFTPNGVVRNATTGRLRIEIVIRYKAIKKP